MRGYLRRTLESARGAEQRLKPLSGSVYAGSARRAEFGEVPWGEESSFLRAVPQATTPRAMAETPSAEAASGNSRSARHEAPSAASASGSGDSQPTPSGRLPQTFPQPFPQGVSQLFAQGVPQPLLTELPARAPETVWPAVVPAAPFTVTASTQSPRPEAAGATPVAAEASAAAAPPVPTLQAAPVAATPPQPPLPLLPARMDSRGPAAPAPSFQPGRRAAEEPDIQVHIGRIEVIAATPPPPRARTPRPNRSTSLSDYLAGRNGWS